MEESMIIDTFPGDFRRESRRHDKKITQRGYNITGDTNIFTIDCQLIHYFLHVFKSRLTNRVHNTVFHLSNISVMNIINSFLDQKLFNNLFSVLNLTKRVNIVQGTRTFRVFGINYRFGRQVTKIISRSSNFIERKCNFAYNSPINRGICNLQQSNEYFYIDTRKVDGIPEETSNLIEIIDLDSFEFNDEVPEETSNFNTVCKNSKQLSSQVDDKIIDVDGLESDDVILVPNNTKNEFLDKPCTISSESNDEVIDLDDLDLYDQILEEPSKLVATTPPFNVIPVLNNSKSLSPDKSLTTTIQNQSFDLDDFESYTPPITKLISNAISLKRKVEEISYTTPIKKLKNNGLFLTPNNTENVFLDKPCTVTSTTQNQHFDVDDFDISYTPKRPICNTSSLKRKLNKISSTPPIKNRKIPSPNENNGTKKRGRLDLDTKSDAKRPKVETTVPEVRKNQQDPREIKDNTNPAWRKLRARNAKEALDMVKREWGIQNLSNPHVNLSHCFINQQFHPIIQYNNGNNRMISCLSVFDSKIADLTQKLKNINRRIVNLYRRLSTVYEYSRAYYGINRDIEMLKYQENRLNNQYGAVIDARREMENLYKFYAAGCSDFIANVPEVDTRLFDQYEHFYKH